MAAANTFAAAPPMQAAVGSVSPQPPRGVETATDVTPASAAAGVPARRPPSTCPPTVPATGGQRCGPRDSGRKNAGCPPHPVRSCWQCAPEAMRARHTKESGDGNGCHGRPSSRTCSLRQPLPQGRTHRVNAAAVYVETETAAANAFSAAPSTGASGGARSPQPCSKHQKPCSFSEPTVAAAAAGDVVAATLVTQRPVAPPRCATAGSKPAARGPSDGNRRYARVASRRSLGARAQKSVRRRPRRPRPRRPPAQCPVCLFERRCSSGRN